MRLALERSVNTAMANEEPKLRPWVALLAAAVLVWWMASLPSAGAAEQVTEVVPIGRTVGIKLFSDGVLVVGLGQVSDGQGSSSPAKDCGLREGDIITHINQEEVDSIEEVQAVLQQAGDSAMSIRAVREDQQIQFTANAVKCADDGQYKLGAWIRDSMAGIGTVTFWEPESGMFGALGHGINDVDTARLMPLQAGSILYAQVADVQKGEAGTPGQLQGTFQVERDLGTLWANTGGGVFGQMEDDALTAGLEPMPVASRSEVKTGAAVVRTNVTGDQVEDYEIEITRIFPEKEGDTRNLMLKVTDPRLLEATGGIVQGMSGSPILQDGKVVGAVTHVLVNDPTQGYGILMETMLDVAGSV